MFFYNFYRLKMRTTITFLLLFLLAVSTPAQNRAVLKSSGEIIHSDEEITSLNLKQELKDKKRNKTIANSIPAKGINGMTDTLTYFGDWNTNSNFGIFGQDWLLQWFQAPTDMIIHKAGISVADVPATNVELEVKLVKLNWKKSELQNLGEKRLGYYLAEGNGYNNITAFQDNPDRTGGWIDTSGLGLSNPFAEDIWSDSGKGIILNPILKTPEQNYQWIDLSILEKEVIVKSGEIVGVAVRNLNSVMDSVRVGLSAGNVTGFYGFKFYSNGRLQPGIDYGWWSRGWTFDFALEVQFVWIECWPIVKVTQLGTSLSTEPRLVSANIEHCNVEDIGKSKVELSYSLDKGVSYTRLQMTTSDSAGRFQTFSGTIPSVQAGTEVRYFVSYTNAADITIESPIYSYEIPKLTSSSNLIVFNGFSAISGFPQSYYFGHNGTTTDNSEVIFFARDRWAYGKLTKELVDMYTNIFEITTTGPKANNNEIIKAWIDASPKHNYLLAGDEYFGSFVSWEHPKFFAGDFPYDILGVSECYTDINYEESRDQQKPSLATAIAGTELGDSLYLKVLTLNEDSLLIDPSRIFGSTYNNWIDGFDPIAGTVVDITAQGIDGKTYNVGAHRTLPAGNKVAFLAFDPLSLRGAAPNYFWYGFDRVSPLVQAMRWFGADVVDVQNEVSSPLNFKLSQNYPNPFNPSTVISFQLSVGSKVSLKVYDILGNEVATLVNEEKEAGNYKVNFNAQQTTNNKQLASGIYFYTLRAGNFVESRKMLLLK